MNEAGKLDEAASVSASLAALEALVVAPRAPRMRAAHANARAQEEGEEMQCSDDEEEQYDMEGSEADEEETGGDDAEMEVHVEAQPQLRRNEPLPLAALAPARRDYDQARQDNAVGNRVKCYSGMISKAPEGIAQIDRSNANSRVLQEDVHGIIRKQGGRCWQVQRFSQYVEKKFYDTFNDRIYSLYES